LQLRLFENTFSALEISELKAILFHQHCAETQIRQSGIFKNVKKFPLRGGMGNEKKGGEKRGGGLNQNQTFQGLQVPADATTEYTKSLLLDLYEVLYTQHLA